MRTLFLALLALGCSGKNVLEPGTVVGTFKVQGRKQTATCGDAATAADPWVFDVRFSRDLTTLYWLQNRAPVKGTVGSDRKVKLTTEGTMNVRAASRAHGACAVTRTDVLDATLGPDEPLGDAGTGGFSSLAGTLSYAFTPVEGSDCTDLTDPSVSVLPCSTVYGIDATKVGP